MSETPHEPNRLDLSLLPAEARPHIEACYEIQYPEPDGGELSLLASAHLTPILNLSRGRTSITLRGSSAVDVRPLVLSGPQGEAYVARVFGPLLGFYVTFPLTGPLALLGVRRYAPLSVAAPMADVVRPSLREAAAGFETEVIGAGTFEERVGALQRLLHAAVEHRSARDLDEARFLDTVLLAIDRADGCLRVDALAREVGVSASTLRRRAAVLGLPLKRILDIVRLRAAVAFLHTTRGARWGDAVERFGYADQAHFIRAHHRLTGVAPTRWDDEERGLDHRLGMKPVG